jgi:thiol:disulfide interchange protein DsbD
VVASPCVGPVLAALLTYVAQTQNALQGFLLLFVFAFGLGQLFLLLGTFSRLQKMIPRSGPWMDAIKWIFALSFFALAIFICDLT